MCTCGDKWRDVAPFLIRVVVGLVFAMHGYQKLQGGIDGFAGFLGGLGFPAAGLLAVLVVVAELGGGILLILGAFTHWTAKVLVVVSVVALVAVHLPNGFFLPGGYEYILVLLAASASLVLSGPGRWSVDGSLKKKKK